MSQNNGILSILCANRQRNHEFSDTVKALMVQAVESGRSCRDVAAEARCSPQAVSNIVQRWKNQRTLDNKPRSGHSRCEIRRLGRRTISARASTNHPIQHIIGTDGALYQACCPSAGRPGAVEKK
ncbi:uncharacterized protein B0J16DRAFT_351581 [Fusarium flagelliforme]|uniref:uncharacterized protein n=1 Tax=Fusarium flagelliforme TaxID=2675880 RepID=UPI001E8D88E5|nr:uncharacterized protein B0J16DRAFT_351581 [Fusarium flagelliforme]KAH7169809.1 hypothetical protein B0J16DRAFT_351581 [Fusarium flagelliforme]